MAQKLVLCGALWQPSPLLSLCNTQFSLQTHDIKKKKTVLRDKGRLYWHMNVSKINRCRCLWLRLPVDCKSKQQKGWGISLKGYLVLIECEGVEVGKPGQPEVIPEQIVVDDQLFQLSEHFEACEWPAMIRQQENCYGSKSGQPLLCRNKYFSLPLSCAGRVWVRACQGSEWQELVVLSSPGMVRHPSAAGRMRDGGHLWVARIQNKRLQKCGGQDEFVNVLCLEAPSFAWP